MEGLHILNSIHLHVRKLQQGETGSGMNNLFSEIFKLAPIFFAVVSMSIIIQIDAETMEFSLKASGKYVLVKDSFL